jgi:hypothetical protein
MEIAMPSYMLDAIVGCNINAKCLVAPSNYNSVISKEFLINNFNDCERLEVDKNRLVHLFGGRAIHPLFKVNIPITLKDKENGLTILSTFYVVSKKHLPVMDIILGYDWLLGGSVTDEELQIYSFKIVHEFEWGGFTRPLLSIKSLGGSCNITLYKKMLFSDCDLLPVFETYSSSDSDSCSKSDSCSESDSSSESDDSFELDRYFKRNLVLLRKYLIKINKFDKKKKLIKAEINY